MEDRQRKMEGNEKDWWNKMNEKQEIV
jgi:hypothetical protein